MLDKVNDAISYGKALANIAWTIGPYAISQTNATSEAYALHKARLENVQVFKELMQSEIKTYTDLKRILLDKYINANAPKRLRIKRDLDEADASLRHLSICLRAADYVPFQEPGRTESSGTITTPPSVESSHPPETVSLHWMDKFNELARSQNEEWRADLLAKALAKETSRPASVSPRVLWLIGTLEKDVFNAFSVLLDLASFVGERYLIPKNTRYFKTPIPDTTFPGKISISNIVYLLSDAGLVADTFMKMQFSKGASTTARYSSVRNTLVFVNDLSQGGVLLTELGRSMAELHSPTYRQMGMDIYNEWISGLDKSVCLVSNTP